jgi:hypothetical protein
VDAGDVQALVELGDLLYWAAMVGLGNVLKRGNDPEGAEALYRDAVEAGDADWSANASCLLGNVLEGKGDVAGAVAAWQRVIGSRSPEWAGAAFISLVNALDSQGDADGLRAAYATGGQLGNPEALPDVLTYDMAIPAAYWKAGQCAVVLVLRFGYLTGEPMPVAMQVTYSRAASIVTGRAAPEVRYLAVVKDGHEDRRPLESHFGAWVVCTEQPGPFDVVGFSEDGDVLARLPESFPRARTG